MNRTHFIIGLIVVSSLLAPSMLCLIPGAMLTAAEAECCRQMGSNCGDIQMPHSCCKISSPNGELRLIAQAKSQPLVTETVVLGTLFPTGHELQESRNENRFDSVALQPSPHLNSIAILRI
jgi:hypothetical protein